MTIPFEVPQHTLKQQHQASNPEASVWVSANAGSGKTHVLTQRVVRLLLKGVAPSKILCLTFTKAAAANMAARVFDTLALWTRLGDEDLQSAIQATGAPAPERVDLAAARKLFARTVETPGGLKIQTIHAFCERLLHLFPFEANVPSRFEVADDMREAELLSQARRDILAEAATGSGLLSDALARVTDECGPDGFETLIKEAMAHRAIVSSNTAENHHGALRRVLGLKEGRDVASIEREMIEGGLLPSRWREIADWLDRGKKTDSDRAALLRQATQAYNASGSEPSPTAGWLAPYLAVFFTDKGEGSPFENLVTVNPARTRPDLAAVLYEEQARLDRLREEHKAAATFERTCALIALVGAIRERYETLKYLRGVLDFDDLIERTLALLERSESSWVLYKLDQGIDHVLVDEAQDTSAEQWKILEYLTSDFASGAARSAARRTFFAVGDEKQSIFSFQGAAPHMFGAMRRRFATRFAAAAEPFAHVPLTQSFRSAAGVLAAVDKIFERPDHQQGLIDDDIWMGHEALKRGLPGLIEIWPPAGADAREEGADWRLPLDVLDAMDPPSFVAQRVARKVAQLLAGESGDCVFDSASLKPRPIRASDILILVRTRGPFFEAVIRALKQTKIPVAGADRLDLTSHIAVMDLVAAGRALLQPQDDLALACVLKSPLIGLDDEDLLAIAPGRSGSLLEGLSTSPEPRHQKAAATLKKWRERQGLSPFAFYSRLLGEDGGRRALEARLGPEACDAIDEFLRLALAHEQEVSPSLVAFLDLIEGMDFSIKRDMEAGADAVRVMTVHAAKGLEAKIVFLPDTCGGPSGRHDPKIFTLKDEASGDQIVAWSPKKDCDCVAIAAARERTRKAAGDEYRRLLYVALTRAEERLYIAGFYGAKEPASGTWSNMIRSTLSELDGIETVPAFWDSGEAILRWVAPEGKLAEAVEPQGDTASSAIPRELPAWLTRPLVPEPEMPPPLRPSTASHEGLADPNRRAALQKGRLMHALLQYLPSVAVGNRSEAARVCLAAMARHLDDYERENLARSAKAVLALPSLADLFGPSSRAEVAIAGRVSLACGTKVEISGRIDRIGETESEVLVADFKTGVPCEAKATPTAYLVQMALYRAVLAPLFPHKRLRMMLIWTEGPLVAWLEGDHLDRALSDHAPR